MVGIAFDISCLAPRRKKKMTSKAQLKIFPPNVSWTFFEKISNWFSNNFETIAKKKHVQGYLVSNLWADIFISFLFMKDFQNFWTEI